MIESTVVYGKRLLLCFSAVFVIFATIIILFQIRSEKVVKEEMFGRQLSIYADIVDQCMAEGKLETDRLLKVLPEDIRITIVDLEGTVMYDAKFTSGQFLPVTCVSPVESGALANHLSRPEIMAAVKSSSGYAIRNSGTAGIQYFYYAKFCGDKIVRVAMPYEKKIRNMLRPDILFIIIVAAILFVSFLIIALLSGYFEHGVSKLHDQIDQEKVKYKEMKHQMTNNIAHELRTPVSSIRGYLETLVNCPDIAPERKQAFIERAYIQTIRLSDLIRDIALITKIEEASDQLAKERICLKDVVDEVIMEFRDMLDDKSVVVENLLDSIHINGNQTLLHAIFRNLVENSLKYGGGNLTIHVECLGLCGGKCSLVYYDTGKGVGEEHLPRIFERFYRVSEGRTRDDGGSGLGLSIVRNAIAFHGGDIAASIRPSGGIQYDFTLSVE